MGEILLFAGTSKNVVDQKIPRSMPALYFINKCDKSTMTDPEIVNITAIYKDKNEIRTCFGFECSSVSEDVRPSKIELGVGRIDWKLVKKLVLKLKSGIQEKMICGTKWALDEMARTRWRRIKWTVNLHNDS